MIQEPKTPSLKTIILSWPILDFLNLFIKLAKRVRRTNVIKAKILLKIAIEGFKKVFSQPSESIYWILNN